jgi:hypothetical protein
MRVEVGQRILLRNTESLEEQFVRVVHVTPAADSKSEVGVEFLKPAPKFWRIAFPPDDWTPTTPKSPPTPSSARSNSASRRFPSFHPRQSMRRLQICHPDRSGRFFFRWRCANVGHAAEGPWQPLNPITAAVNTAAFQPPERHFPLKA